MTAIFITATGTNVGKTQVVASLIRHLRQFGRTVEAIKPIVSGYDTARAAASDPGTLIAALGSAVLAGIHRSRFALALSCRCVAGSCGPV